MSEGLGHAATSGMPWLRRTRVHGLPRGRTGAAIRTKPPTEALATPESFAGATDLAAADELQPAAPRDWCGPPEAWEQGATGACMRGLTFELRRPERLDALPNGPKMTTGLSGKAASRGGSPLERGVRRHFTRWPWA